MSLILITGIGVAGKSTFRRLFVEKLVKKYEAHGKKVEHFDVDNFQEVRDPRDANCLKNLPDKFSSDTVYVIEDVRGLTKKACLLLDWYSYIFYLKPNLISHVFFWLSRMWRWFQSGKFSWNREKGWKGTGKPYDFPNLLPILKCFFYNMKNRRKWIREDMEKMKFLTYEIIRPYWKGRIRFK
jgi:hypothetical protein